MEMKFTPGPWSAGGTKPYKGNEAWIFDSSTPEKLICFLGGEIGKPQPSISEELANAHLIAAAPDMLAALTALVDCYQCENGFVSDAIILAAKAAINKALNL